MDEQWRSSMWRQFGAAIDMLGDALRLCPEELWQARVWDDPHGEFWNVAYHTLLWLDLYLSGTLTGFFPPPPVTLEEIDPSGRLPERPFSKDELLTYLAHTRAKCQATISTLTDARVQEICAFPWGFEMGFGELQLYNMRHVQEHAAQLKLLLGPLGASAPSWRGRPNPGT